MVDDERVEVKHFESWFVEKHDETSVRPAGATSQGHEMMMRTCYRRCPWYQGGWYAVVSKTS
jgi:hypothetical protein